MLDLWNLWCPEQQGGTASRSVWAITFQIAFCKRIHVAQLHTEFFKPCIVLWVICSQFFLLVCYKLVLFLGVWVGSNELELSSVCRHCKDNSSLYPGTDGHWSFIWWALQFVGCHSGHDMTKNDLCLVLVSPGVWLALGAQDHIWVTNLVSGLLFVLFTTHQPCQCVLCLCIGKI